MADQNVRPSAAGALRHLAQAVQALDAETPRIEIGNVASFAQLEADYGPNLPEDVRRLYLDSNPISLTVPMPVEDIEFTPLSEIADLSDELELPGGYLPFAVEGDAPYVIDVESGTVKIGAKSSQGWEWEEVATSLADFLSALAAIAESFAGAGGDSLATKFEVNAESEIQLEERLSAIDEDRVDRWLEWLA